MSFVEDFTPLFADFGVDGTLAGASVRVIFDNPTQRELGGSGAAVVAPQVQIPTASVPASVYGATLVIPQGTFKVRERDDDGTGLTFLTLGKG